MLTPEQLGTWSSVATLLERLPAALDAQLQRDSGLTHFELGILTALDSAPDRTLRLSVLAGYASCTLSRLSRAIDRLARRNSVQRSPDPSDGRFTLATLTDEGRALVVSATPAHHELVGRLLFEALTPAQARAFGAAAARVAAAVDPAAPLWVPPPGPPS